MGEYLAAGDNGTVQHGFILQGDAFFDIDFPGGKNTNPSGINGSGLIVGFYVGNDGFDHGFLRERDEYSAIDVPFPGAFNTFVTGINDSGQIVGTYTRSDFRQHGFLTDGSSFTPIDVPFPGVTSTAAHAINNNGDIVGLYQDGSGPHGFIFSNGVFTRFDVSFPGVTITETEPADINDLGEIVGAYSTSQTRGFLGFLAKPVEAAAQ